MITKEVFQYFKEIGAHTDVSIEHEKFLPIREQISIAAASNYVLEDKDNKQFWLFFDKLIKEDSIKDVYYVMEDLWTKENEDKTVEELFKSSEDAYLKYIIFTSNISKTEIKSKIVEVLNKKFSAECFINSDFGEFTWCITWDSLCIYRPMKPPGTLQDPVSLLMAEYPVEASHGESLKP